MKIAMGVYDAPQKQEQPIFYMDTYKSNIAVFGGPMTGKTTFLRTLLVRLHEQVDSVPEENIYIIDFGGNLGQYDKLSRICACFNNSNEENIKRIFKTLEKRIEENSEKLTSKNYYELSKTEPEKCPPHLTLIIDNINAFLSDERYASYQERLIKLCRDGISKGLNVIVTANDISGTNRLMANFGQKVAFEMPSENYFEIFNTKVTKPMRIPGRGIINIEHETFEFQCFLPFENETELDELIRYSSKYDNPNKMAAFTGELTLENFENFCAPGMMPEYNINRVTVGLDYYDHNPVSVDINETRSIAIYGKRQFGKSNLLNLIISTIDNQKSGTRFVFLDDGRKQLTDLYDKLSDKSVYFTDTESLRDYLAQNGYGGIWSERMTKNNPALRGSHPVVETTPFTVFVLQGKSLYQTSRDAKYLMYSLFPEMLGNAEARNYLFIFSDVKNISDAADRVTFNNYISAAFLLDNIGEFVSDKGNKSVFGEMDAKELKAEYAKCSVGDGYYYDIETDILLKLRFIKA